MKNTKQIYHSTFQMHLWNSFKNWISFEKWNYSSCKLAVCFELANKSFVYRTELVTYHTEDCISVLSPLKKTFETLYTIEKENVFLKTIHRKSFQLIFDMYFLAHFWLKHLTFPPFLRSIPIDKSKHFNQKNVLSRQRFNISDCDRKLGETRM